MSACLNPAVQIAESPGAYEETLAERLAKRPLRLRDALRYAIDIATCLRHLHAQGLAYGAVSSPLILLGGSGAALRSTGRLICVDDGTSDLQGFGTVLGEMARRVECSGAKFEGLRDEISALAGRCTERLADIQQVLIGLRILALYARQMESAVQRGPEVQPPTVGRLRFRMTKHWRPLSQIATFALFGK